MLYGMQDVPVGAVVAESTGSIADDRLAVRNGYVAISELQRQ
jgi:hypothetical protein